MSEKVTKVCELCWEQPATVLCSECHKCYCGGCEEFMHKKASMKGHEVENIPDDIKVDARCPIHKDNPLEMFCIDEVKLCCGICNAKELHKSHNVVEITNIKEDNELFSASDVKKHFVNVLKCDGELEKRIGNKIDEIRREAGETKVKIEQTFKEAHDKLNEEEAIILEELEERFKKCEDALSRNLVALKDIRVYSDALNEAAVRLDGKSSRLMELNIVSEMEKQWRTMQELHKTKMTVLKFEWVNKIRKLSFAESLFNGAPVPNNIKFPAVFSREFDVSWERNESKLSEEDKTKVKCVVEMKKSSDGEDGWKEAYSGKERKCNVDGLEKNTEYNVRVKCVIGDFQGEWSDVANVKTKNIIINSSILSHEENAELFKEKLGEWCRSTDFELLYQGTRNGFGASAFHSRCDNKGKTLVLIKNASGHIFGGFSSIPWESSSADSFRRAPGSFIFTLKNMHNIGPTKFPLGNENDEHAVRHYSGIGPNFGNTNNGDGIWIVPECNLNTSSYGTFSVYKDTTGKGYSIFSSNLNSKNFSVQEIEVFKVNN